MGGGGGGGMPNLGALGGMAGMPPGMPRNMGKKGRRWFITMALYDWIYQHFINY